MNTAITARIAAVATLALAILPAVSLGAAHAATPVHVNATPAAYQQSLNTAVRHFCGDEKSLSQRAACETAVRAEAQDKFAANLMQVAAR